MRRATALAPRIPYERLPFIKTAPAAAAAIALLWRPATNHPARRIAIANGVHHAYTGNVHDGDAQSTCRSHSGERVIQRKVSMRPKTSTRVSSGDGG